ncbi:BhlA/UviB family holin-like peptide [Longirhabdus pacifica]|uniref:BhlA/UviB family holin-like peptide n=1 Tax=Longirhabdus pacifica TaxID=2305227 RepID=UPI001008ED3F|nr:BhlA/UviB family holin-like peptide [Longirhabdus pacifica]
MNTDINFIDYFSLYGPFAVLFVSLFYWTLKTYTHREELYRKEIIALRKECEEQDKRHHEMLSTFFDKYNILIDKLDNIEAKLDERRGGSKR